MATYFVDYEGGNDSNDGLSFANRKKTTNTLTDTQLDPNDTVRIMASAGRGNTNITATWTANSNVVSLSSNLNILLYDGNVAWTANVSGNVSCGTNSTFRRMRTSNAAATNVHVDFVTGKASYFTLPGVTDCSGYTGLTFWFTTTVAQNSANLSIRLCSDTTGDVPVDTFVVPTINLAGFWAPLYVDKGSALAPNIQSIAIYVDSNTAAVNVMVQNISTVKSANDTDNLNLTSLINPGNVANNGWWGIREINGSAVYLDRAPHMGTTLHVQGYAGNTETVFLYKTDTTQTRKELVNLVVLFNDAVQQIMASGTESNLITYSGGWNRTDMSTQTGETWYDGVIGRGVGMSNGSGRTYYKLDKVNFARYRFGVSLSGKGLQIGTMFSTCQGASGSQMTLLDAQIDYLCGTAGGEGSIIDSGFYFGGANTSDLGSSIGYSVVNTAIGLSCGQYQGSGTGVYIKNGLRLVVHTIIGNHNGSSGMRFTTDSLGIYGFKCDSMYFYRNYIGYGLAVVPTGVFQDAEIGSIVAEFNRSAGVIISEWWRDVRIRSIYSANNLSGGVIVEGFIELGSIGTVTTLGNLGAVVTRNISFDPQTLGRMSILNSNLSGNLNHGGGSSLGPVDSEVSYHSANGVIGDHRTAFHGNTAYIHASTEQRHTANGSAWKIAVRQEYLFNELFPVKKRIAMVTVGAGTLVTLGLWCYRTSTTINGMLAVPAHQVGGLSTELTAVTAGAANVWEQLTVSFTPTETGTIEVEARAWGGDSSNVWIDDFSVTQG